LIGSDSSLRESEAIAPPNQRPFSPQPHLLSHATVHLFGAETDGAYMILDDFTDSVWQEAVAVVRSVAAWGPVTAPSDPTFGSRAGTNGRFFTAAYAERVERVGEEGAGWQGPDAPPLRARPA